jgi:hypothetical protein
MIMTKPSMAAWSAANRDPRVRTLVNAVRAVAHEWTELVGTGVLTNEQEDAAGDAIAELHRTLGAVRNAVIAENAAKTDS